MNGVQKKEGRKVNKKNRGSNVQWKYFFFYGNLCTYLAIYKRKYILLFY